MGRIKGSAVLTKHVNAAVTPELKQAVDDFAERLQVSPSLVIRWALTEYMQAHGNQAEETGDE